MFALACIGFLCRKRAYYFEKGIRVIGIDMRQRKSQCLIRLENGKLKNGNRTPEGDGGRLREKSATQHIFSYYYDGTCNEFLNQGLCVNKQRKLKKLRVLFMLFLHLLQLIRLPACQRLLLLSFSCHSEIIERIERDSLTFMFLDSFENMHFVADLGNCQERERERETNSTEVFAISYRSRIYMSREYMYYI